MSFDTALVLKAFPDLLAGLLVTAALVASSLMLGSLLGSLACWGKLLRRGPLFWLSTGYVGIFRSVPEPVLIFWIYFCGPLILSVRLSAFGTGTLALSLVAGAYLAEIFRAGLAAVPRGQIEAGRALGLPGIPLARFVLVPQAVRIIRPALFSYMTTLTKNSALVSAVGVGEVFYRASIIASDTFHYLELFTALGGMYLALILPFSLLSRSAERLSRYR